MPGRRAPNGTAKPTTVGLQHASGPRVAWRLRDLGCPLPDGWRITQDHPRRGLVAQVPADADNRAVIDWLLRAATLVCTVPIDRSLGGLGPRRPALTVPAEPARPGRDRAGSAPADGGADAHGGGPPW